MTQVKVVSEPERIDVFLTRSCVQVTDISCGVVYEATLASLVLFRSYCYVPYFLRLARVTKLFCLLRSSYKGNLLELLLSIFWRACSFFVRIKKRINR